MSHSLAVHWVSNWREDETVDKELPPAIDKP
jgi:hypothetical protein